MSEYQYITFRAIDAPLDKKALKYMHTQSTRAEIDEWSFTNEYHYGDFRGDALEMLRRGYDMHLHYANFGIRTLMIRLPDGFPDAVAAKRYFDGESVVWHQDKKGSGGIVEVSPFYEAGELEELWNIEEVIEGLLPIRSELLEGDLRPLYLMHLAVANDGNNDPDETREAPVPAGLDKLTKGQEALAEFYELDRHLIAAAAEKAKAIPVDQDRAAVYAEWLQGCTEADKNAWLLELMTNPAAQTRRTLLNAFRAERPAARWPTVAANRTISELGRNAQQRREEAKSKAQADTAREREKQLREMAANPEPTLRKTEELVSHRSTEDYARAAALLADLREAIGDGDNAALVEQQALKLRKMHPKSNHLSAALRQKGFSVKLQKHDLISSG